MVIWITGLSGSGKTTLAAAVCSRLKEKCGMRPILLDGDVLREVIGAEGITSFEGRKRLSAIYARLANILSDQGFVVVVSTISMFESIRQWNASNNNSYLEVYLQVSTIERKRRDPKGLYAADFEMVDAFQYELPKSPHFCFEESVQFEEKVERIVSICLEKILNDAR